MLPNDLATGLTARLRLFRSTISWCTRRKRFLRRYFASIASNQWPYEATLVNIFADPNTAPINHGRWADVTGQLAPGTRGAAIDILADKITLALSVLDSDEALTADLQLLGRVHSTHLVAERCVVIDVCGVGGEQLLFGVPEELLHGNYDKYFVRDLVYISGAFAGLDFRTDDTGPVILVEPDFGAILSPDHFDRHLEYPLPPIEYARIKSGGEYDTESESELDSSTSDESGWDGSDDITDTEIEFDAAEDNSYPSVHHLPLYASLEPISESDAFESNTSEEHLNDGASPAEAASDTEPESEMVAGGSTDYYSANSTTPLQETVPGRHLKRGRQDESDEDIKPDQKRLRVAPGPRHQSCKLKRPRFHEDDEDEDEDVQEQGGKRARR